MATATAQQAPADFSRLGGRPDLNGLWQTNVTANWNLEAHSAADLPAFPALGAIAAIPPGISYVEGGTIPYLPAALAQRDANRAAWPEGDPEANCYMPGIPRLNYMPYPFQIVQGNRNMLFAYEFATANRTVYMEGHHEQAIRVGGQDNQQQQRDNRKFCFKYLKNRIGNKDDNLCHQQVIVFVLQYMFPVYLHKNLFSVKFENRLITTVCIRWNQLKPGPASFPSPSVRASAV